LEETCRLPAADGGLSDAMDMRFPHAAATRAGRPLFRRCLEPRRRIDRALLAVAMEAYVHGTSTRKVDDLVKALGVETAISKSEVPRICAELDRCGRTPDLLKERSRPGVGSGKSPLSPGPAPTHRLVKPAWWSWRLLAAERGHSPPGTPRPGGSRITGPARLA
jgi:hypothetical protein